MRQHDWKKRKAPAHQEPAPISLEALSPGPAQWVAGFGAWTEAAKHLAKLPQPLGLAGEADLLRRFRKPLSEAWLEAGLNIVLLPLPDGVECCKEQALTLAYAAEAKACVTLVGLGGGKALDLAKWAAQIRPMTLVTVPTSAATCAGASAVVVAHKPDGSFDSVLDLPKPASLCIVDFDVLKEAPAQLLAAGMADTLAKWLEWRALEVNTAGFGAGAAWILAEHGALACESLGSEALKEPGGAAWATCVEACLLWSAQASCLGSAPAAAAHSLANALTAQPEGRSLSHGAQVGLGLLWQEALLAQAGETSWGGDRVRATLSAWGLAVALPPGLDLEALLGAALAPGESVHSLDWELSVAQARQALQSLIP